MTDHTTALLERFKAHLKHNALLEAGGPVIVGVSGGVDSMVLLDLLRRVTDDLHVVHVNYGFRDEASDADERLVRTVCEDWGIVIEVHTATDAWRKATAGRSLQEAARELRYEVMFEAARKTASTYVAVAHNFDDQAETVLLRLFRGTGVQGFAGMRASRPLRRNEDVRLIRPLLFATREEIEMYASKHGLAYRDDHSNDDLRFERVRVRRIVLPAIGEAFGRHAVEHVVDAAERIGEIVDHGIVPLVEADLERLVDERAGFAHIDLNGLTGLPSWRCKLVLLEALRRYLPHAPRRAGVIEGIETIAAGPSGKHMCFDSGSIWRDREYLVFVPEPIQVPADSVPIRSDRQNETVFGKLTIERLDREAALISDDRNVEVMDGSVLEAPLSLGPWLPGERFQPLGLSGTKKISDFLTDEKVPTYLRHAIPVVRSGEHVAWVAGFRLAHPFRLTEQSTTAVRMRFSGSMGA